MNSILKIAFLLLAALTAISPTPHPWHFQTEAIELIAQNEVHFLQVYQWTSTPSTVHASPPFWQHFTTRIDQSPDHLKYTNYHQPYDSPHYSFLKRDDFTIQQHKTIPSEEDAPASITSI